MQISVVRPEELGPGDIAAWRAMQASGTSLANPFLSPEFAIAVGRVRPGARVAVLTDGTSTAGFFPFERRGLGVGVPIASVLTDCQGLIHAPGVEWDPRRLLRACRISVWKFDHLADGQHPFHGYRSAVAPSPVIDLADGFAGYDTLLRAKSPQVRSSTARKERKLAREIGPVRFELDSADSSALRQLMAWKSAQYRRTGRPDRFAQPWVVGLVDLLQASRGDDFSGLLSVLYAGDAVVAVHFGIRSARTLAYWFTAYDPEFGRYSPGLIKLMWLARDSYPAGIRRIDLGKGDKWYKEKLKTGDISVSEGIVTGYSPLATAHRARIASAQWAMRTVRGNQRLFVAADWMLKRFGRSRDGALTTG